MVVHCSNALKPVKLKVENISREVRVVLNGTETVSYKNSGQDDSFITFSPIAAGSPVSLSVHELDAVSCTFSLSAETETDYEYLADCKDTTDLKVLANVSNLEDQGLSLLLNGTVFLEVNESGRSSFSSSLKQGDAYEVTIQSQPEGGTCTVSNGSGTIATDHAEVQVACQGIQIDINITNKGSGTIYAANSFKEEPLGSTKNRFCALTMVRLGDIRNGQDPSRSEIRVADDIYYIRAGHKAHGGIAECRAQCITWDENAHVAANLKVVNDVLTSPISNHKNKEVVTSPPPTLCGLSRVEFQENEDNDDWAHCKLLNSGDKWSLRTEAKDATWRIARLSAEEKIPSLRKADLV